jgi:glyoxylase-like metal-dependent hydrolase (beta-lactamase superfamily II)
MSVAHDLFGDGTIQLLNLPGHARGQFGALVRTATGPVLLAADGCWLTRSFRENRPPHRITRVFADDVDAAEQTVAALGQYARLHPDVDIIPAHCPDAWARHASGAGS